jgi:hypothetical protein
VAPPLPEPTAFHSYSVETGTTPPLPTGVYTFVAKTFKPDAKLVTLKAMVGVDEDSFRTQREAIGIWTVFYYDERVCRETARYGKPKSFTCQLPGHPADLSELRIQQSLRGSSARGAGLWAGLIDPIVVVKE